MLSLRADIILDLQAAWRLDIVRLQKVPSGEKLVARVYQEKMDVYLHLFYITMKCTPKFEPPGVLEFS